MRADDSGVVAMSDAVMNGRILLCVATLAIVPARSDAAMATFSCPATLRAGQQFVSELTIDVGSTPLGAYVASVAYAPSLLAIAAVGGGNTREFSAAPMTDRDSFTSGGTSISAFQAASLTSPTGVVSVAKITLKALAASPSMSIQLTVSELFDTGSRPIPVTATGCTVSVTAERDPGTVR